MREHQSLSHTKWNCKHHIVFYRKIKEDFEQLSLLKPVIAFMRFMTMPLVD